MSYPSVSSDVPLSPASISSLDGQHAHAHHSPPSSSQQPSPSSSSFSSSTRRDLKPRPESQLSDDRPPLKDVLPSASDLLLRSFALGSAFVAALVLALFAWIAFYQQVRLTEIGGRERVDLQYGHYRAPYARIPLPRGKYDKPNQAYDVALELVVPLTGRNLDVGNFMISMALIGDDQQTLVNVSRPATLRHPAPPPPPSPSPPPPRTSLLLRPLKFFFSFLPNPLVSTHRPSPVSPQGPTQRLVIPLLEHELLQPYRRRAVEALLEVGRRDAHPVQGQCREGQHKWDAEGEVQVYDSWLRLDAHLTGLRYLLHYHPILSFLFFTPLFLLIELFIAFLIWISFIFRAAPTPAPAVRPPTTTRKPPPPPPPPPSTSIYDTEFIKTESSEEEFPGTETDLGTGVEEEGAESEDRGRSEFEGMIDVEGGTEEEDTTERESVGVGVSEEEEEIGWGGKDEEEGTVGGSETTRATLSTFGPSLTGTSSTTATRTSGGGSSGEVRSRVGRMKVEED